MLREIPFNPSSNILAVTYDDDSSELYVQFKSGKTYRYSPIPAAVADGFAVAASAGQYLNAAVKDAGYSFSVV